MQNFQHFCHFLNASWKSCSVKVFKCHPRSFQLCQNKSLSVLSSTGETVTDGSNQASSVSGGRQPFCFWSRIPWWERKCKIVSCHDATISSFVIKVWGEVLTDVHTVAIKCHSSMQNWLFGLPGWILCETFPLMSKRMMSMLLTSLFILPLGGLLLCFSVTTINQTIIISDNSGQEGCIVGGNMAKLVTDNESCCFWSVLRTCSRPDKLLQIKGRKELRTSNQLCGIHTCTSTPKITYHCIVLLQLLYRWQHQSR
jgi:hypothetical protein